MQFIIYKRKTICGWPLFEWIKIGFLKCFTIALFLMSLNDQQISVSDSEITSQFLLICTIKGRLWDFKISNAGIKVKLSCHYVITAILYHWEFYHSVNSCYLTKWLKDNLLLILDLLPSKWLWLCYKTVTQTKVSGLHNPLAKFK